MMTTSTKRTLLVVVVWLLALVHQQPGVSGQCIRNLTEIALSEVFVTNTEFRRQYILCRNTMFEVGVLDQDGSIVDGYFPLAMKGNATVQCGRTGRRENNCLITFGDIGGLFSPFVADDFRPIDFGEATVRGITFDDLLVAPIFVNLAFGSLTFIDCAFLNSVAQPNIQLASTSEIPARRRLRTLTSGEGGGGGEDGDLVSFQYENEELEDDDDDDDAYMHEFVPFRDGLMLPNFKKIKGDHIISGRHHRKRRRAQEEGSLPLLSVFFFNCLFQNNRGPVRFDRDSGLTLIYIPTADVNVNIRRSSFDNNQFPQYDPPNPQAVTKALISSFGDNNEIVVEDTCFTDNAVTGFSYGQSWNTNVKLNNLYFDPTDPSLACPVWSHISLNPATFELALVSCLGSDALAAECELLAPTMAPSQAPTRRTFCLSAHSVVDVENRGPTDLQNVLVGDRVLVSGNKYEPVYSFGHLQHDTEGQYVQIFFDSSKRPLEITPDHMVFVEGHQAPIPASQVQVGDKLILANNGGDSGSSRTTTTVQRIRSEVRQGMYAPFTPSGTIVINGIVVSTFVAFQGQERLVIGGIETPLSFQWLAHSFEAPHRVASALGFGQETYTTAGVSNWVATGLALTHWFMNQHVLVMALLLIPLTAVLSTFMLVESLLMFTMMGSGNNTTAVALTIVAAIVGAWVVSSARWNFVVMRRGKNRP